MTVGHWLLVALGGAVGSVLRVALQLGMPARWLPWGTVTANLLGSFALGVVLALLAGGQLGANGRALLAFGFCGGFTTFSTFALQITSQLESGQMGAALANLTLSLAGALLCAWLGLLLGRALWVG